MSPLLSRQIPVPHRMTAMLIISVIATVIGATELLIELLDNTTRNNHDRDNSKSASLRTSDGTTQRLQRRQPL